MFNIYLKKQDGTLVWQTAAPWPMAQDALAVLEKQFPDAKFIIV